MEYISWNSFLFSLVSGRRKATLNIWSNIMMSCGKSITKQLLLLIERVGITSFSCFDCYLERTCRMLEIRKTCLFLLRGLEITIVIYYASYWHMLLLLMIWESHYIKGLKRCKLNIEVRNQLLKFREFENCCTYSKIPLTLNQGILYKGIIHKIPCLNECKRNLRISFTGHVYMSLKYCIHQISRANCAYNWDAPLGSVSRLLLKWNYPAAKIKNFKKRQSRKVLKKVLKKLLRELAIWFMR